ncbi:Predicted transcriptional regulator, contains HTH domain [Halogeometricum rufum]|uniref:Predicted transcriptional regulator, contains HTH domain n=1 Tax=Halogeometricum rufum TaxID=553469 RepID=A0A1I6HSM5_9EURY|nr:transcriptional regulator FilR1 domain-containing protein [Halogeometricum rufum]SFR57260.1 Predicted transcriptional regulator, contains HTH domain [Halogeometricum rufum]
MDSALEEIEFLALSANRVEVLDALTEGAATRRELEAETGASQPTLGRILGDFTDRGWITHDGARYVATATGRLVAEAFTDLWETMETELKLRDVAEWLPTESLGFDLGRLGDATITVPTRTRPGAPVQRVLELLEESSHVRIFSHAFNEQSLEVVTERTVEGVQTFEGVFSPDALDAIAHDSTLRQRLEALLDSEAAEIRLHEGPIPLAVTITDDVVHLLLRDDEGLLRAALDTDDDAVLSWAREAHERYWRAASPLDVDDLE